MKVLEGLANSNIRIVGQERDGIVLLTRVAYDKVQSYKKREIIFNFLRLKGSKENFH
jgi:hypothetical protein